MKAKKIITICSSAVFYKRVLEVEKDLKQLGFQVKVPSTAKIMEKNNDFDVAHYKTWYQNKADYRKKKQLMDGHFKKVVESDGILIINDTKHGMPGYIGGNVLMEMTLAYHLKKPIYIYNDISQDLGIKEEVYGLFPIFLNQDLTKIKT